MQMDYTTGICKLIFKPDYSDLGQWTCKFTVNDDDDDIEIGSATLILLNTLAGPYQHLSLYQEFIILMPHINVFSTVFTFIFLFLNYFAEVKITFYRDRQSLGVRRKSEKTKGKIR